MTNSPGPRRETGVVGKPPVGQVRCDVGEVAVRIEVVESAGTDERVDDGGPVSAAVFAGAEEEVVLATDGDGADGAFGEVVVERQDTAGGVEGERVPQGAGVLLGYGFHRAGLCEDTLSIGGTHVAREKIGYLCFIG